jgi:hypothetical protein
LGGFCTGIKLARLLLSAWFCFNKMGMLIFHNVLSQDKDFGDVYVMVENALR